MTHDEAKLRVVLLQNAIDAVRIVAENDRRLFHTKHIDKNYQALLDDLDLQITGARAKLTRLEVLGK